MLKPLNKRLTAKIDDTYASKKASPILTIHEPTDLVFRVIDVAKNEQGIEPGDRILVSAYHAVEKSILGEEIYLIHCDSVYGVLT